MICNCYFFSSFTWIFTLKLYIVKVPILFMRLSKIGASTDYIFVEDMSVSIHAYTLQVPFSFYKNFIPLLSKLIYRFWKEKCCLISTSLIKSLHHRVIITFFFCTRSVNCSFCHLKFTTDMIYWDVMLEIFVYYLHYKDTDLICPNFSQGSYIVILVTKKLKKCQRNNFKG